MLFALSFEDNTVRTVYAVYFFPKVETKDYHVMINGKNVFNQQVKYDKRACANIQKIAMGQGDDYKTDCRLDYPYFKEK